MTSDDFKIANLRENPFHTVPADRVTVWAGHESLKKLLHGVIEGVRIDKVGLTECVVLYGELGTGKSHSLRYFRTLIDDNEGSFRSVCVYLETLRVANKVSFLEIYRTIIERIGRPALQSFAKALVGHVKGQVELTRKQTPAEQFKIANESGQSLDQRFESEVLSRVMGRYAGSYRIFELLASGNEKAWFYLSAASQAKLSTADLSELRITGTIESDFDAVENLGLLVNLTCGTKLNEEPYWKAFYLFLDEVEVLADQESRAMISINQSLRDLLNACPEHLCLILSLSGDAALVEGLFVTHLLSRMTREPIAIPSLDQAQGVSFLKDVLNQYRLDNNGPDAWHPFTKEAIEYIVSYTTDKTPRWLFRNAYRVLELAANKGLIKAKKQIQKEDAEQLLT